MRQRRDITDQEFKECFEEHQTLGMVAHELQIPHVTVHRRAAKLGLKFKLGGHYKGQKKFKFETRDILEGKHPQYPTGKVKKRIIDEKILPYKCNCCGISEWNEKHVVLHLDHINGVPTDHRLENLQLICPNCHSQTDTWCGKNK